MTRNRLPSAVVDTNVFVSGFISRRAAPHVLLAHFRAGDFQLIITAPLMEELSQVLHRRRLQARFRVPLTDVEEFLTLVRSDGRLVIPRRRLPITSRDAKDDKLLAAALGGHADYLVTGDNDLLVLQDHSSLSTLKIVTAVEFLAVLSEWASQ